MADEVFLKVVNNQKITIEQDMNGVVLKVNDKQLFVLTILQLIDGSIEVRGLIDSPYSNEEIAQILYDGERGLEIQYGNHFTHVENYKFYGASHILREDE